MYVKRSEFYKIDFDDQDFLMQVLDSFYNHNKANIILKYEPFHPISMPSQF